MVRSGLCLDSQVGGIDIGDMCTLEEAWLHTLELRMWVFCMFFSAMHVCMSERVIVEYCKSNHAVVGLCVL